MKKTIKILLTMLIILAMFIGTGVLATEVTNDIGAGGSNTVVNNTVTGSDTGTNNTTTNTTTGSTTETGEGTDGLTWTDFSNVEFEIELNNNRNAYLIVKNLEKKPGHYYYYCITAEKTKPEKVTNVITASIDITELVELNQDFYIWVVEQQDDDQKFVIEGKKLERPTYYKDSRAFQYTLCNDSSTQIILNAPFTGNRKMKVKIGEVTDSSILKAIKNNESGAWNKLLEYSKKANAIVNTTVPSSVAPDDTYHTGYYYTQPSLMQYSQVKDKQYYFLYAEVEDENGKYYPVEGVTLGLGNKFDNPEGFSIFFYGNDNFEWNLGEDNGTVTKPNTTTPTNTKKDNTTAKGSIPYTGGATIIVLSIAIISIAGTIAYIKNRDLKGV